MLTLENTRTVGELSRVGGEKWSGRAKWKTLYRVHGAKARIQAMKDTSRILDLKYKLQTIELLNLAKEQYTYRELSGILHLPETVLSRYVKGHVLPTAERAEEINRTLQKYMSLEKELHERIKFDDLGYFDNTGIINDTMLLERAVQQAVGKFAGKRGNKVRSHCYLPNRPSARQDGGITLPFIVEKVETSAKNHQTPPAKEPRASPAGGGPTPLSLTMPGTTSSGATTIGGLCASRFRGATL